MKVKEMPVYLFLGFLDSGKTTFMQGVLEDERFNDGDRILVLLCEEGETGLDPSRFPSDRVFIESIDRQERFNPDKLSALAEKYSADRVMCEYNGMWPTSLLYQGLPEGWQIAQCFCFFHGPTAEMYNMNMRSLVADKITLCEMAVFNRLAPGADTGPLHKLVRGLSRRCDIAYEYEDGSTEYDDEEDPLPFDKEAAVIDIADRDYALWYRDLSENMSDYAGKQVKFLAVVAAGKELPAGSFFAGRHVMTCCEEDIAYNGLLCVSETGEAAEKAKALHSYDWIRLRGEIRLEKNRFYKSRGPVIHVFEITPAEKPESPVAVFY